ncbi:MAG: MerR family transcriptional regulator [Anaerolineales bacterium]
MVDTLTTPPVATIEGLSASPKYNIKAVCVETGIRPVTLRAWERRYRLLSPHRTRSNYRLYSERDVAVLRWLKMRVDSGLPISTAANELSEMRRAGAWPEPLPTVQKLVTTVNNATPPSAYAMRLYKALSLHDESAASVILKEAYATCDLTTVCNDVLAPCLAAIGDAWQRGELSITTEHYASNYIRGRLMALFHAQPMPRNAPRIFIGCAPSELHDIGSLMLALLLRREGYRVEFLGQDVHIDDLLEYARMERPGMICLAATQEQAARELRRVQQGLANLRPKPKFGYGGRIFNQKPALRESVAGIFLGETLVEACNQIRLVLSS